MMPYAGILDPSDETFREYERVVDPKYLKKSAHKRNNLPPSACRQAAIGELPPAIE